MPVGFLIKKNRTSVCEKCTKRLAEIGNEKGQISKKVENVSKLKSNIYKMLKKKYNKFVIKN